MSRLDQAKRVQATLAALYPDAPAALVYGTPWELMVAVVLSAQCTDERVNKVTPALFARWPGPRELAEADIGDLEEVVRSTGFFRQKAKNLLASAKIVCDRHGGELPRNMAEMTALPGVARKTANVVLFGAFGINEGIAVDTHVKRVAYRLGLTIQTAPEAVERDLMEIFPRGEWGNVNRRMVLFGREYCMARKPDCPACGMKSFCPALEPPKKSRKGGAR